MMARILEILINSPLSFIMWCVLAWVEYKCNHLLIHIVYYIILYKKLLFLDYAHSYLHVCVFHKALHVKVHYFTCNGCYFGLLLLF